MFCGFEIPFINSHSPTIPPESLLQYLVSWSQSRRQASKHSLCVCTTASHGARRDVEEARIMGKAKAAAKQSKASAMASTRASGGKSAACDNV